MKQLIKALVPRPVLQKALEIRDAARLHSVPVERFNATPLRPANQLDLNAVFASKDTEAAWQADHQAVTGVFGDSDRFGGVNPGDRRALYYLIHGLKPQHVLEVGTHIGASTLYIARALKTQASRAAHVTTVDLLDVNDPDQGPWRKVGLNMAPKDYAGQLSCQTLITFRAENSLSYLRATTDKFDFIFLDGDHSPTTVYQEVAAALRCLNPNGVIMLHDYYPQARPLFPDGNIIHGPFHALDRVCRENPDILVRPLGNLPWPTKQGSHATSLALLTRQA